MFLFGALLLLGGLKFMLTGDGGYRSGYAHGDHVRFGGALIVIFGAVAVFQAFTKNKPN